VAQKVPIVNAGRGVGDDPVVDVLSGGRTRKNLKGSSTNLALGIQKRHACLGSSTNAGNQGPPGYLEAGGGVREVEGRFADIRPWAMRGWSNENRSAPSAARCQRLGSRRGGGGEAFLSGGKEGVGTGQIQKRGWAMKAARVNGQLKTNGDAGVEC